MDILAWKSYFTLLAGNDKIWLECDLKRLKGMHGYTWMDKLFDMTGVEWGDKTWMWT